MNRRENSPYVWLLVGLLGLSVVVMLWGIYLIASRGHYPVFAAGFVATVGMGALTVVLLNARYAHDEVSAKIDTLLNPVNERLQHLNVLLNQVAEQQLISERAKAIAFRDEERETLRRAIREDISKKDYDAALILANDIEAIFGYKQEADRFREEIAGMREAEVRHHVNEAITAIDWHCRSEQWTAALREAERVMALYPGDGQAQGLVGEIENRRQAHKRELLSGWHEAVGRHDVDGSIEILKRLDLYLTPAEAEQMQETARQVFKDKLMLLGQQFTQAVKDHNWHESLRVGELIVNEYPNSRMAQEVREKWDVLQRRASEPETAEA